MSSHNSSSNDNDEDENEDCEEVVTEDSATNEEQFNHLDENDDDQQFARDTTRTIEIEVPVQKPLISEFVDSQYWRTNESSDE